jgi:hypothetical protein
MLSAFVPKDPDAAGCEITLRRAIAQEITANESIPAVTALD